MIPERKRDLEDRLVELAIRVVKLTQGMRSGPAGRYYGDQILRSSGSAALNYAESQGGETHRDFTHKLKVARKEIRETGISMRIIRGAELHPDFEQLSAMQLELKELLAILTAAVLTAEKRSPRK